LIDAIAGKICVDLAGLSISIGEQRPDVHQDEVGRALDFEVFYTSGPRSLGNHCGARSKYEPGRIAPCSRLRLFYWRRTLHPYASKRTQVRAGAQTTPYAFATCGCWRDLRIIDYAVARQQQME
jgi:hypothetical protein